ncbi:MAG TPA: methylmalonyl-CoA epimerase [Alphaproteobacteria bacterium]|nr:methylmalonyl-CoA epimerase [Alphaproteobacteria bacterium]
MKPELDQLRTVDHLGIVVPDLEQAIALYRDVFGCDVSDVLSMPDQGIEMVFVTLDNTRVELLAATAETSPIKHVLEDHTINDFLERSPGGGLHHICYVVDDLKAMRERLTARGMRVLGSGEPIIGASGQPIVFLDPDNAGGTLIELKQKPSAA